MKLPKISLSKASIIVQSVLVISLLFPYPAVYALTSPEAQPESTHTQQIETGPVQGATSSATVASDDEGEVKGFWFIAGAIGIGILLDELFGGKFISSGLDCVKDFGKCVEGAVVITQNVVYKQSMGCDFVAPVEGTFPKGDCNEQNMQAVADAYKNDDKYVQMPNGGFLQIASNITTASLEVPVPIEGSQYFASINPFATARAQDATTDVASQLGSNKVLLEIWQKVRDASYALMVVVLVVIGFLIMIRWKYDSRTAVTLQNSLPKIAVALILITFSFAIAGFMADIIRTLTSLALDLIPGPTFNLVGMILLALASATAIGAPALAFLGSTIAAIALLLFALILIAIVFAVFINVIFKIITRYVIFILLTLFAPLFFLVGALPGADGVTLAWFKRAAAALVVIPAVAFVIKLSFRIGFSGYDPTGVGGGLPQPFFVPNPINSVLGWMVLGPIVGLGLFFFATKVPEIVDNIFGIKPLPRGGIGPGAILGAPIAGLMFAGNIGRALKGTQQGRGAIGNYLKNRGWGGTPNPTNIKPGMPVNKMSPDMKKTLGKAGALGPEQNIPTGKDVSGLPPDWQKTLATHGQIDAVPPDLATGRPPSVVTKGGTIQETKVEGQIQESAQKLPGVKAAAARRTASLGSKLHGADLPPQKTTFRTSEQIKVDEEAAAKKVKGPKTIPAKDNDD